MTEAESYITLAEAVARTGLSRKTFYNWFRRGVLPLHKQAGVRATLILPHELEKAIADRPKMGAPFRKEPREKRPRGRPRKEQPPQESHTV